MSDIKQEIQDEIKAIGARFDEKIRDLDRKAQERYDELKKSPDAITGEGLKAILADKEAAINAKTEALREAMTERMDELEAKARNGHAAADPDAAVKAALEDFAYKPSEFGTRGRLTLPLDAVLGRKAVVTMTNANAGGANFVAPGPTIYQYPQQPLRMRDVIQSGSISQSHFKFEREKPDQEGGPDYQGGSSPGEGETKPTVDMYTEIVTREVATIAVTSRVSQQLFDDRPAFLSFLRGRMGYLVEKFLDGEILNGVGNGSNGELEGINTIATAYNDGHVGKADATIQHLDVLRFALSQVELANYVPNYIALHPTDLATIETKKDDMERYLVGDPMTGGSTGRIRALWGVPVVSTAAQAQDDFTVGDGNASQLLIREGLSVLASTEDQDNFVRNLVTLRAEMRALLANYSAVAHVTGDFSDAIAAT